MKDLDLVVFGATGYVGQLVAAHLAHTAPQARIGLAGRSKDKLEKVRDGLGNDWPLLVVDAGDPAELVEAAKVVCTTVGPYAKYGLPLVDACARSGTHYVDLTGETLFVRTVITDLDAVAQESGAKLVPSCGFDAIPSDLAVWLLHQQVQQDGAGELLDTVLTASFKGGVSGGTVDSMKVTVDTLGRDPSLRALIENPYALSAAQPGVIQPPDRAAVAKDAEGRWTGPFVMAQYNTRVVRRSNDLLDYAYGKNFRYQEQMSFGKGRLAPVLARMAGLTLALAEPAMGFRPTRALLDKVLPNPGEGPSEKARNAGWFRMDTTTTTTTGARYSSVVAGKGDPGYAATAVMMGESALALALDDLPDRAGVLTPATAMGDALVTRLRQQGMELSVRQT